MEGALHRNNGLDVHDSSNSLKNAENSKIDTEEYSEKEIKQFDDIVIKLYEESLQLKIQLQEIGRFKDIIQIISKNSKSYQTYPIINGIKLIMYGITRTVLTVIPLPQNIKYSISFNLKKNENLIPPFAPKLPILGPTDNNIQKLTADIARILVKNISFSDYQKLGTKPEISIIIPVYNNISYTVACLKSLHKHFCPWTFEIIVVDDASLDMTESLLSKIPGLRYFRNKKNLGFIKSSNVGFNMAKGDYVVFLNNDTIVHPGWLTHLRQTFEQHASIGIVGSKMVFGDGSLQEAGGIIWEDASGWNVGRTKDPNHPDYNYLRDVDYVSGASLMIPKKLFTKLGCFDEIYVPAYYEDTDLCFSARKAGYRVLYQPLSKITHFESISSGSDTTSSKKKCMVINQETFKAKWADVLTHHLPNAKTPNIARDRYAKEHILIIDSTTPEPDKDAGSIDMINLIDILLGQGYRVHFIPQDNFSNIYKYTEKLQEIGVHCIYAPHYTSVSDYLIKTDDKFDLIIIARMAVANDEVRTIKKHLPNTPRIFYTVDLHYLREMRAAKLSRNVNALSDAKNTQKVEIKLMQDFDTTIVLSQEEYKILSKKHITGLETLPLLRNFSIDSIPDFNKRDSVAFVGGYRHLPNIQAVHFLLDKIWPLVTNLREKAGMQPITLRVGGSNMPDELRHHVESAPNVEHIGYIDCMASFWAKQRLSIAPLIVGAGLKGKVAESWGYGVPVIGTSIAFEGMPSDHDLKDITLQGEDAQELAQLIIDFYDDAEQWHNTSEKAASYAKRSFSTSVLSDKVSEIISHTKARAKKRLNVS